jgi:hypothetical protein
MSTTTDTALLVIDAQESFRHRPYYVDGGVGAFVKRLQALVDGASGGASLLRRFSMSRRPAPSLKGPAL